MRRCGKERRGETRYDTAGMTNCLFGSADPDSDPVPRHGINDPMINVGFHCGRSS